MNTVAQKTKLIPGTPLMLGTDEYICPALNFGNLKKYREDIIMLNTGLRKDEDARKWQDNAEEFIAALVRVMTAALQRNYPDFTEEDAEMHLDLNNIQRTTLAVLGASGFYTTETRPAGTEGTTLGESTGTA